METYPVQVHVRVRARDLGSDGLVHESSLLTYFHEARQAYLRLVAPADDDGRLRVVTASFTVLRHIAEGDNLAVRVRVDELARSSARMSYLVRDRLTGETVSQGLTTLMLMDEDGAPRHIPDALRDRVSALEGRAFLLPA